jgi:hypothetical protein
MGIESLMIYVHELDQRPSVLEQVVRAAAPYPRATVIPVFGEWLTVQFAMFDVMQRFPDDWFVVADQDEFHLFPRELSLILETAEARGYDCVNGCFVDRVAEDGSLRPLTLTRPLWEQYPFGAFLTFPICRGNFRKVVLAKGHVRFTNSGHHEAISSRPYPATELLVEVHHFKWVDGVLEYLSCRSSPKSQYGAITQREGHRFIRYFRANGNRIAVEDPGLLIAECNPRYLQWGTVRDIYLLFNLMRKNDALISTYKSSGDH